MNISYDNQKIADLIKTLILKSYDMPTTGTDLTQASKTDVNNYLKSSFDPTFLNNTSFYDNYAEFQNTLSDAVQQNVVNAGKGIKYNLIVNAYNKLVRYLESGLNYNSLSNSEKTIVDNEMTKLISNVQSVKQFTKSTGPTEMYNIALQNIEDNLGNHIYGLVTIELKKSLEAMKKKLTDQQTKIMNLIRDYKINPISKFKMQIKNLYTKHFELYKRVAKLFPRTERKLLKINDETFNQDIENILGINNRDELKDIADAVTNYDGITVAGPVKKTGDEGDEGDEEDSTEKA